MNNATWNSSVTNTTIAIAKSDEDVEEIEDYGLIITITHLSLYFTLLLGVSICAVFTVRKEMKQHKQEFGEIQTTTKQGKKGKKLKWYTPFKMWLQLVQEKRKVYIMLLPHLFDQAV